jgi:hypothetical protein
MITVPARPTAVKWIWARLTVAACRAKPIAATAACQTRPATVPASHNMADHQALAMQGQRAGGHAAADQRTRHVWPQRRRAARVSCVLGARKATRPRLMQGGWPNGWL